MTSKQSPGNSTTNAEAEIKLQEALARMKAASDRHAAVVAVMSRIGTTPEDKRLAQSEGKKVDRELRDARRLLREAQELIRTNKVDTPR